jgi:hypothetical protein
MRGIIVFSIGLTIFALVGLVSFSYSFYEYTGGSNKWQADFMTNLGIFFQLMSDVLE